MLRSALLKSSLSGFACCMLFAAAQADVYKYKDEKGKVLYTDKPMFLPAERMSIKTGAPTDPEDSAAETPDTNQKKPAQPSAAEKKKTDQSLSAGKAEACNKARQDYLARMNSQRIYEEQANGEKRFLSEKEMQSARNAAKQAMDALCN